MAGDFGSYIDKKIRDQIAVRQNIRAQKNGAWTTGKNAELYSVDHQNVPWICLRSSVDAAVEEYEPGKKPATSPELSKKYVLCGGTLTSDDKGNLKFARDGGIGAAGYGLSETFGYRPRPGITKVTVKTKDTFGCIMEATVDFLVWSVEDLEAIDKIYFKPGMSALLEWGHSVYVNNRSEVQTMSQSKLYSMVEFLKHDTFEDVDKNVQARREKFDGNYEAIFGYIINFNWSFNNEGSYTCQLKLISKGSVLEGLQVPAGIEQYISKESLKAQQGSGQTAPYTIEESSAPMHSSGIAGVGGATEAWVKASQPTRDKTLPEEARKSPYHFILYSILKQVEETKKTGANTYEVSWNLGDKTELDTIEYWGMILKHRTFWKGTEETPIAFIRLDTFLQITNRILEVAKVNFPKFSVRNAEGHREQGFVSFKEHFSLDAYKALLPYVPTVDGSGYTILEDKSIEEDSYAANATLQDFLKDIRAFKEQASGLNNNNCIADIMVGVNFILDCVNQVIGERAERYEIRSIVESILAGVQKALGNINSFDIHINHETNTASVVDRNCISHDAGEKDDFEIQVSGKSSVLTNVSIKSEVSVEMANEMSIAATAPDDSLGGTKAIPSQVFWNEGCEDRHNLKSTGKKTLSAEEKALRGDGRGHLVSDLETYNREKTLEEKASKSKVEIFRNSRAFLEKAANLYVLFFKNQKSEGEDGQYEDGAFEIIQNDGEDLFQKCVNRDISSKGKTDIGTHFQSSMIPVKINLTMKGIGRFVIGTTFKVSSDMLPKKYRNWRHIITNVEHSIDSGGWLTTVQSTYYYPAGESDSGGNKRPEPCKFDELATGTPPYLGMAVGTETTNDYRDQAQTTPPPKDVVEKFFQTYWDSMVSQPSICAGYVASMAKSWVAGQVRGLPGGMGNAGDTRFAPNTVGRTSVVAENLKKLGWTTLVERYNTTARGVKIVLATATEPGDIAIYYNLDPNKSTIHQHAQMKTPTGLVVTLGKGSKRTERKAALPVGAVRTISSGWTTSYYDNYGCSFVYSGNDIDNYRWDVIILRAPKINWK